MEGVSDDVFVFISVCLLSIGCGYLGDRLLSRNRVRSIPPSASEAIGTSTVGSPHGPGAADNTQGPRPASADLRTAAGFSESEIAVQGGQLPMCPICLDQVSNAVETSWYLSKHYHADFI